MSLLVRQRSRLTAVAAAIGLLLAGCAPLIVSDSEPVTRTPPPPPRNPCEAAFATRLTNGIGLPETPPGRPDQAALVAVMEKCTADELLEADDYFMFAVGDAPMTMLLERRLFNGPDRSQQLVELCGLMPYDATRACRTVGAQLR